MSICTDCDRDMLKTDTCNEEPIEFPDGTRLPQIKYGDDWGEHGVHDHNNCCHDCRVKAGGFHHPGCDMEQCPRCKGQLISCGCLDGREEA